MQDNSGQLPTSGDGEIKTDRDGSAGGGTPIERAEDAIRESAEQFRAMFEVASIGMAQADVQTGRWLRVNHKMCAITGYSADEMLKMRVSDVTHPEDRQKDWEAFQQVVRGEAPDYHMEKRYVRKDGSVCWVNVNMTVTRNAGGHPIGTMTTIEDITGRKRKEENLRRLATVVRDSNDAITIQDFDGGITAWNRGAEQMYGYSEKEALLMNIERLTAYGKVAEQKKFIRRLIAGEAITSFETQRVTKDGRVLDVWMTVTKLMDGAGNPIGLASTERDITERKREEENLRRMATVVRDSNDAITIQDFEGRITAWNRGAELMYGYSEEEALLMNIERLTASGKVAEQEEFIHRLIAGEAITSFETQRVTKDGRVLDVWMTVTKLMDATGNPNGLASTERDITERQRLERLALRAQRLDAIGTLAGGVAHDLNNALAPILMGAEIIKTKYPGEVQLLDMVEASAKRAAGMAKQLLTFAKGAEGERVLIHPGHLIKELENLMKGTFPKNIQVMARYDSKLPPVLGDPTQLHQVLLNLCVNARDAMPHGGTLTLEAESQEVDAAYASSMPGAKPGNYLTLCVRDTGTGIPPEIIDRIFDPFFTTKGPDKGTGLGLSTVLGIVKGAGGFLQVYSKPGQGSIFTAYLPADLPDRDAKITIKSAVEFRGQGETILFVDDEPRIRDIARTVLRHLNLMPLTATDGADGLIQAALHRAELGAIITDLHMPYMDGLGFVSALRRMLPDIPVMVISGRMEDAMDAEFKTLGVTSRLDKPFTEVQLGRALETILKK